MQNPISQISLNNLEYNTNRDPQVYRRSINKPFNLKVKMIGSGSANVSLKVAGETISKESVSLPGLFEANPSFDSVGTRVGTILVESGNNVFETFIRFDVLEKDYTG